MNKIINAKVPKPLLKKYQINNVFLPFNTRLGNNILVPRRVKQIYQNSIFYKGIISRNTSTDVERNCKSLSIFERKLN